MKRADPIVTALLKEAQLQGITPTQLAKSADLSYATCAKFMSGKWKLPTLAAVFAIAGALKCQIQVGLA